jgi:hypothetical protein
MMMEAVPTSETPIYSNEITGRYFPEGSHLHIRSRENLKSHMSWYVFLLYGLCATWTGKIKVKV